MPTNRSKRKISKKSSTQASRSANQTGENRESLFNDFATGLAAASSPPEQSQLDETFKAICSQLEEEYHHTCQVITTVCDRLGSDLGSAGSKMYPPSSEEPVSVVEAVKKAIDENPPRETSSHGSRKVTWNSNSGSMPPPSTLRRPRKSRSVERLPSHTTILSHRPRLSRSNDRLGLRTPASRPNHHHMFNIATVTPHPEFQNGSSQRMTILRQANPGELALSMSGSPLMVNTNGNASSPSVTIPLVDGRIFHVLGECGLAQEEMKRGLDNETVEKLKKLKDVIDKLV